MPRTTLVLEADELTELTGYKQASKQVDELRQRGFWRARLNPLGRVVLERSHYEAVCAGAVLSAALHPQLRSIS